MTAFGAVGFGALSFRHRPNLCRRVGWLSFVIAIAGVQGSDGTAQYQARGEGVKQGHAAYAGMLAPIGRA